MKTITSIIVIATIIAVLTPIYANAQTPQLPNPSQQFQINGAGATFPFPLLDLWRVEYNKLYPNVNLNYQSIGSGGGVKQHIERTVDFAATDAPLTPSEMELAPGTLHIPEAIGGVVVAYNVPEIPNKGLKLTGMNIADIYLGKITKWNDPKIIQNNPELNLPDKEIVPARRSDGSGTTFVFTDYLSTVSPEFEQSVGKGKSVPWPVGLGAAGNEGVAATVRSTPYSIGYVELAYAFQTGMSYAYVQNRDKTAFVEPTLDTISAASGGVAKSLPKAEGDWSKVTLVNAPGSNSYPIASFTYLLVYENIEQATKNKDQANAVVHMINWMITDGQKHSPTLLYVPLSDAAKEIGKQGLARVKYNGETVWKISTAMPQPSEVTQEEPEISGGGCLIATAAFGSELAPQVQFLREIRDNTVMSTQSGASFMTAFNAFYYSFSPTVADWERQNPVFKEAVKVTITPLISSLSLLQLVDIDTEQEMLGYGIGIILMNVGMYFVAPALVLYKLKNRRK